MDDKSFLQDFHLKKANFKKDKVDLHVLRFTSAPKNDCTIFIFTQADNARIFFQNPNHATLFTPQNIFVFQNENVIPAGMFQTTDSVYLLSCCPEIRTDAPETPPGTSELLFVLHRIFIFNLLDYLKKNSFSLPNIVSDDDYAIKIANHFITKELEKYKRLLGIINSLKKQAPTGKKEKNVLIYNIDDEALKSLYHDLLRRGENVFIVNNHMGWINDVGPNPQDDKLMSDVEFAEYLIENNIHYVVFRNYYDMGLMQKGQVSKIWIMRELGIHGISFYVDTMIEYPCVRFDNTHWLPDNIQVINPSVTESYDALSKWMCAKRVHKCPQVVEFSQKGNSGLQSESGKLEGVMVASNSRLDFLRQKPQVTLFIVPLAREIILHRVNVYNAYFLFIDIIAKADKLFGAEELKSFYYFIGGATLTLRSLLRYSLIACTARAARKMGLPFNIFGSEDWRVLFPDAYIPKYLNRDELHQAYQKNIVLIPTPSTTFESQHPSITKVLLLGGRSIAPAPFFGGDSIEISSLKRFYFAAAEDIGETLLKLVEDKGVRPQERDMLLGVFGVECLGDIVQGLLHSNENHKWGNILGGEQAILLMSDDDRKSISAFSDYILLLFSVFLGKCSEDYFLSKVKEKCFAFLSQEVEEILDSSDQYIYKLRHENDILGTVIEAIF